MIEINLMNLPMNRVRFRNRRSVSLGFLMISVVILSALIYWFTLLQHELRRSKELESRLRQESLELGRIEAHIAKNQSRQLELERYACSLEALSRTRCIPVKVLDTIASSLPAGKEVSLRRLSCFERRIQLSGESFDFASISDFAVNLEGSKRFKSVELNRWETNGKVVHFEMLCVLKE